jgi:hypothetical protein
MLAKGTSHLVKGKGQLATNSNSRSQMSMPHFPQDNTSSLMELAAPQERNTEFREPNSSPVCDKKK